MPIHDLSDPESIGRDAAFPAKCQNFHRRSQREGRKEDIGRPHGRALDIFIHNILGDERAVIGCDFNLIVFDKADFKICMPIVFTHGISLEKILILESRLKVNCCNHECLRLARPAGPRKIQAIFYLDFARVGGFHMQGT
jgi:hypothetical protein